MKLQVSLDDKLVKRLDNYAQENYMSRSGLISFACNQFLNQVEITQAIKTLELTVQKIADNGAVDDELLKKLEDFERISKKMIGVK